MMKNKLRSTKMKQVATNNDLQLSATSVSIGPLPPPSFPEPTKQSTDYLDGLTINSDNTITLKFLEKVVMEGSNIPEPIVRKLENVENYAGVNVDVYYLPKEETVTNFTWKIVNDYDDDDDEYSYDGPYSSTGLPIKRAIGNAIGKSKEEKLQYTVNNYDYNRGGDKRLYINCVLEYESTKNFYFYVDP